MKTIYCTFIIYLFFHLDSPPCQLYYDYQNILCTLSYSILQKIFVKAVVAKIQAAKRKVERNDWFTLHHTVARV